MRTLLVILLALATWLPAAAAPAAQPELVLQTGHVRGVTKIAFSPDGRLVATGAMDGAVKIWETRTGKLINTVYPRSTEGHERPVPGLAFSPDGRTLATSVFGPRLELWEPMSARRLGEVALRETGYKQPVEWTPDGRALLVGATAVEIYDVASRKKIADLPDSAIGVQSMAVSADRRTLVAGGSDGEVRVWDLATRSLRAKTSGARVSVSVAIDGSGGRVLFSANNVEVWDLATQRRRPLPVSPGGSDRPLALSPDGGLAVVGDPSNRIFDVESGRETAPLPGNFPSSALAFSTDGTLMAAGDEAGQSVLYQAGPVPRYSRGLLGHSVIRSDVAFTNRGQRMITTGLDRTLQVWDCTSGRPIALLQLPWDGILAHRFTHLAAQPTGSLAAIGSWDGTVEVWDLDSRRKVWSDVMEGRRFRQDVSSMTFSADGRWLAAGNLSGHVYMWEASSGKLRSRQLVANGVDITSLAFSGDCRTLACGRADGFVDQYDVGHFKMGRLLSREVYGPNTVFKGVCAVAFTPDGRRLAASTSYGNVYVWEAESEAPPQIFGPQGTVEVTSTQVGKATSAQVDIRGGQALICAAFSPDASTLATGTADGSLILWDVRSGQERSRSQRQDGLPVNDVAFTPDGRRVATAGADGAVTVWEVPGLKVLAQAIQLDRGKDWVVTTPDGLFDGSPGGQRLMEWRIGDRLFALDQFFNEFYTPGLLGRVLGMRKADAAGEVAVPRPLVALPVPPRVQILSPTSGQNASTEQVDVKVQVTEQGGGLSAPALYLNGHRISDAQRRAGSDGTYGWQVKLVAGANRLRATAFNREGTVESRGDEVTMQCDLEAAVKPTLHVVTVGIDHYQNGMSLAFARADADAMARFFKPGLFGAVKTHVLLDDRAAKKGILDVLTEVARSAAPQDAVVLYLAGHGTLVGQSFYYLPYDAKVNTEDEIRATGLSSGELGEALTNISATKQLLILDACHSGASASSVGRMLANRDSIGEIRAVQRLSRSSGSFLIAASKAEQFAKEIPELGHGVLTYAILTALGEKSPPAATANGEGQVTVNSLLHYLGEEVPRLTQKYQRGERQEVVQASTGQDFPLVIVITR